MVLLPSAQAALGLSFGCRNFPQPLDKPTATCCLNSSHILSELQDFSRQFRALHARLLRIRTSQSRNAIFALRAHAIAHRAQCAYGSMDSRAKRSGDRLARTGEMHAFAVDDDLAGARARVVVGAHREPVRARRAHGEQVARREREHRGRARGNRALSQTGPTICQRRGAPSRGRTASTSCQAS